MAAQGCKKETNSGNMIIRKPRDTVKKGLIKEYPMIEGEFEYE
jgi:hypothetical protein